MSVGIITFEYFPFRKVVFHTSNAGLLSACRQTRHEAAPYSASTLVILDNHFTLASVIDALTVRQAEALSTLVLGEEVVHGLVNYWCWLVSSTSPFTRLQRVVCSLSAMPSEKEMEDERHKLRRAFGKNYLRIDFAIRPKAAKQ